MARRSSVAFALLALAGAAMAQPRVESVTVTGTRSRAVMDQYIQNFAAPTRLAGKLARWHDGVCPQVVGIKPDYAGFIARRIREVAAQVGAPLGADGCRTNIQVVFTTTPQALIDNVYAHQPEYLGYANDATARRRLATVTRPLEAWYSTATRDLHGQVEVDGRKTMGTTMTWPPPPPSGGPAIGSPITLEIPNGRITQVTGGRLGDGLKSELAHVVILAEPARLGDFQIGALADYIAMLSLTQLASLDVCQPLPSIVNLLVQDCAARPAALTDTDTAYLKGLYAMGADRSARTQADQIGYFMQQHLEGK